MIMNKRILYLLSVLCFFSFSACTSEEEPVLTEELGEIWLSVVDTSKVEVVTRALSGFDVKDFNVSLSRGETMVFSSRKYGDIAGSPITCSAGSGYLLTAESCTESEAERTNSGWGQARLAKDTSFTVKPVEPNGSNAEMCLGKLLGKCRVQRFYQEKPLGLRYHPVRRRCV